MQHFYDSSLLTAPLNMPFLHWGSSTDNAACQIPFLLTSDEMPSKNCIKNVAVNYTVKDRGANQCLIGSPDGRSAS